ncbi:MAG TPA: GNAT family N-acetyltransferase [Paracoccaceae bacterium]
MSGGPVSFRIATRADLAGVDALLSRSYPRLLKADYPPSVLVTALPLISRARPELVMSGSYWVAGAGGRIVGAGGWTPGAPEGGRRAAGLGHVRHVVTDADRQREGIGRGLMEHVLAQARAAGILRLDCLATRTAVPFYAALGFRVLGTVEVPLRPGIGFPAVRMELDL